MVAMYVRIILFILVLIIGYSLLVFYVPVVGKSIDDTLWVNWNASLTQKVENIFSDAKNAQNAMENKLDNPAPNTSKRLDQRLDSVK